MHERYKYAHRRRELKHRAQLSLHLCESQLISLTKGGKGGKKRKRKKKNPSVWEVIEQMEASAKPVAGAGEHKEVVRKFTNFKPCVWGDYFITPSPLASTRCKASATYNIYQYTHTQRHTHTRVFKASPEHVNRGVHRSVRSDFHQKNTDRITPLKISNQTKSNRNFLLGYGFIIRFWERKRERERERE